MRKLILLIIVMSMSVTSYAQMTDNGVTLYGNEWIDYDKQYLKITLDEDAIHKLTYDDLVNSGFPAQLIGSSLQLYTNGKEVAILTTSEEEWTSDDFLLFYGKRNDGELDKYHYRTWDKDQLNLKFNMYTNVRTYYLTWDNNSQDNLRITKVENDVTGTLPERAEYYMHKEEQVFSKEHWGPPSSVASVQYSSFIRTEGFGDGMMPNHVVDFPVSNEFDTSVKPRVEFRLGTNLQQNHRLEFEINSTLLDTDVFSGLKVADYAYSFDNDLLQSNTRLSISGKELSDNNILAHATLFYPRAFDANHKGSFIFEREGSRRDDYYVIQKFLPGSLNYAFDLENNTYLIPFVNGNKLNIHIPQGGPLRSDLLVIAQREIKTPQFSTLTKFESLDNMNPEFLILTSEKLNNDVNGDNPIQAYADFRSTALGGSYRVGTINVEDIYDQFGYGIYGSSYAIKNFSSYIISQWPDFQMVFIIGKAVDYSKRFKDLELPVETIVPTYGHPGSDNLLFAEPGITYPFVATGRLAARTQQDVRNYLKKVTTHAELVDVSNKTVEERLWLKNIIHLSGGDVGLQQQLFNHLEEMRHVIENGDFGGKVNTYRKTSSDPVQTEISQEILEDIDNGLAMLTFFGHSSAGGFDFSIEDPRKYNNAGKLPIILSMGCNSGDIHEAIYSLSEEMILTEDVGALAFIASSGAAFPSPLSRLGKDFYEKLADNFYGKPIGIATREVSVDLYDSTNVAVRTLQEQNTIHGDPAIRLYSAEAPDFVVDFSTINTNGQVGSTDEKITLNFDIVNLGRGILDSMNNMIVHEFHGTFDTTYFRSLAPPNRTSLSLEINNGGTSAIGKNIINIILDIDNKIAEAPTPYAEDNNDIKKAYNNDGFCFFVFDNSAFPIYPKEFAIVNRKDITLKASASNAFATPEYYLFEIDTTENFDSPLLERGEVLSSPGYIQWDPSIEFENEVVYYWRISPKEMINTVWNYSSFVYLENSSEGWNQSHAYQWLKDDYKTMSYDEPRREFLYTQNISEVQLKSGVHPTHEIAATVLSTPFEYAALAGEMASGIYISVFDKETGLPWYNQPGPTGGLYESTLITSWALNWGIFPFPTHNQTKRYSAIKFLEDVIPDGSYVSIMTVQRSDLGNPVNGIPQVNEWEGDAAVNADGRDLLTVFESFGAKRIRELATESVPYIFAFRKGDDSFEPIEVVADNFNSKVELNFSITGRWFEGDINSTVIGPAQEWNRLQWSLDEVNLEQDEYQLDLIGVKDNGEEDVLFPNVDNFDFDISFVDSDIYQFLKLKLYLLDEEGRSPAQMGYWRVLYKEKPEAVLDVGQRFTFESDTLFLGETFKLGTVATNISNTDMDSLLVKYTIVDETNNVEDIFQTLPPLKAQETTNIDFEFNTENLLGLHQFRVEINPAMAQPEQYAFNNIGIRDFTVRGDRINPILDVTFDGMHIMDGDIISPKPHIKIDLRDENEYLLLKDISSFDLALRKLPDNQSFPIDLNTSDITFTPADTLSENKATIDYYPELETGEYILYVQAKDVSGNLSGDQDVEVRFRVIEESQVSSVLNYPNPFSTSTQFVFTLTGYEVPEVFTIQIMTVTGKVVREITKEELGNLRIGVNRTDYKWNGTDEYGSKLANGVYLYRVMTSTNNEAFNHFINDDVDGFFKEGFGKLVIMR